MLQPSLFDGGSDPEDRIATVSARITPSENAMDVAIARVIETGLVSAEIEGIGYLKGVADPILGSTVMKVGRTGLTSGTIQAIGGRIALDYGSPVGTASLEDMIELQVSVQ